MPLQGFYVHLRYVKISLCPEHSIIVIFYIVIEKFYILSSVLLFTNAFHSVQMSTMVSQTTQYCCIRVG